jgi:hypothetical protein
MEMLTNPEAGGTKENGREGEKERRTAREYF